MIALVVTVMLACIWVIIAPYKNDAYPVVIAKASALVIMGLAALLSPVVFLGLLVFHYAGYSVTFPVWYALVPWAGAVLHFSTTKKT